jgi:3-carboxy-cis,cis-muconate cycloisomerase
MGQDILVMSQTEINEAIENATGGGKSSTMPHKNNPVLSEALVMIARKNALLASVQLQSLVHANERDATAWALEWENVGQMMHYTGAALNHSFTIAKHLKINEKSTQRNLDLLNGLIYSEAASFILAKKIGRDKAKEIVNEACKKVVNEGKNLTEMLSELTPDLTIDWVSELSIEKHLGTSKEQSNQAIKLIRNQ